MTPAIVNNRIAGTRITVYDIYYYMEHGRSIEEITELLPVTVEQAQAAIRYIEEHKAEVHEVHRRIEVRNARGNSPEVEAKLEETRIRMQAWLQQRREAQRQEANGEGHSG